jgi:hypothetical protein
MSDINKKLVIHALIYGLILAGVQILIQLIIYITGVCIFQPIFSVINLLITTGVITFLMAFASVKFRDKYLDHKINFLKCWMIGLIVGIVSMLAVTLYSLIFHKLIGPEYFQEQMDKFRDILSKWNVPEDKLDEIILKMKTELSIGKMILQSVIFSSVIAFFMSLLATVFVRKKEKIVETTIY